MLKLNSVRQTTQPSKTAVDLYPEVKRFYHLSVNEGITQLLPLRGEFWTDRKKKIKRVSIADTMHGCVQALMIPNWNQNYTLPKKDNMFHVMKNKNGNTFTFYVYTINPLLIETDKIIACDKFDMKSNMIFDIQMTGEVAYKDKIDCSYLGKVDVKMLSRSEYNLKYSLFDRLPITTWCTQPFNTTFHLSLLDSVITTENKNIQVLLKNDLESYKRRLKKAFKTYMDYIEYNANKNKEAFMSAYNALADI